MQKYVEMSAEVQAIDDGMAQASLDLASVNVPSENLQNQEAGFVAQDTKSENTTAAKHSVKLAVSAPSSPIKLTKPRPRLLYIPPKQPQKFYKRRPSPQWLKMM